MKTMARHLLSAAAIAAALAVGVQAADAHPGGAMGMGMSHAPGMGIRGFGPTMRDFPAAAPVLHRPAAITDHRIGDDMGTHFTKDRGLQREMLAADRFDAGRYHGPDGWHYRRWRYGEILPVAYWANPFWLTDYWDYDLGMPPAGCEWIRYGPDALLIDTASGQVVQSVYDAFL